MHRSECGQAVMKNAAETLPQFGPKNSALLSDGTGRTRQVNDAANASVVEKRLLIGTDDKTKHLLSDYFIPRPPNRLLKRAT